MALANLGRSAGPAGAAVFDDHAPQPDWFAGDLHGTHGFGHAARVLFWADVLARARLADGLAVDIEVVRWAAVLHDSQRISDASDPEHGRRAADWVLETNHAPLWRLSTAARQAVAYCCEWHVPLDAEAPRMTPELVCLKDADSLDRVRFGSLQRRFLRTPQAHRLVTAAQLLFDATSTAPVDPPLQWVAVQAAGRQILKAQAPPASVDLLGQGCFSC